MSIVIVTWAQAGYIAAAVLGLIAIGGIVVWWREVRK